MSFTERVISIYLPTAETHGTADGLEIITQNRDPHERQKTRCLPHSARQPDRLLSCKMLCSWRTYVWS